uniref:Uncharacterized protein n=1 Tax=Aegilops tauschii TaxID=37682 RepID=M8BIS9_AEGTA
MSDLMSLKPDWNSETELPTAWAAIFDISPVTAVLEIDDVARLENFPCMTGKVDVWLACVFAICGVPVWLKP